jgi:3-deoxy-manno-octulosonate cytidylyltransferase (CMP-KDO synthetase)
VGIYGFRRDILLKLTELKPSPLELTESLEQLRWLEAGYTIYCVKVESRSIGVDTPDDLKTVEALLQNGEPK